MSVFNNDLAKAVGVAGLVLFVWQDYQIIMLRKQHGQSIAELDALKGEVASLKDEIARQGVAIAGHDSRLGNHDIQLRGHDRRLEGLFGMLKSQFDLILTQGDMVQHHDDLLAEHSINLAEVSLGLDALASATEDSLGGLSALIQRLDAKVESRIDRGFRTRGAPACTTAVCVIRQTNSDNPFEFAILIKKPMKFSAPKEDPLGWSSVRDGEDGRGQRIRDVAFEIGDVLFFAKDKATIYLARDGQVSRFDSPDKKPIEALSETLKRVAESIRKFCAKPDLVIPVTPASDSREKQTITLGAGTR